MLSVAVEVGALSLMVELPPNKTTEPNASEAPPLPPRMFNVPPSNCRLPLDNRSAANVPVSSTFKIPPTLSVIWEVPVN